MTLLITKKNSSEGDNAALNQPQINHRRAPKMYVSMYNSPFPKLNPKVRYKTALERAGFDVKKSSSSRQEGLADPLRSAKSTPMLRNAVADTSVGKLPQISNRSVPNITLETRSVSSNSSLMAEEQFNNDTGNTSNSQNENDSLYNNNNNKNENLLKMQSYQQSGVVSIDLNSDSVESFSSHSLTNMTDDKDVSTSTKLFNDNDLNSILHENNPAPNLLLNNSVDLLSIPDGIVVNGETSQSTNDEAPLTNSEAPSANSEAPLTNNETIPLLAREIVPLPNSETIPLLARETVPFSDSEAAVLPNVETVPLPSSESVPSLKSDMSSLERSEAASTSNIEASSISNSESAQLSIVETISLSTSESSQLSTSEDIPLPHVEPSQSSLNETTPSSTGEAIPLTNIESSSLSISEDTVLSTSDIPPVEKEEEDPHTPIATSHDSKLRELIDQLDETSFLKGEDKDDEELTNTANLTLPSNMTKKSSFYLSGVSISSNDQQWLREGLPRHQKGEGPCRSCAGVVTDHARFANELSGQWHKECFRCIKCDKKFNKNNPCYILDDQPYCRQDYHIMNHTMCQICDTFIEGECLENDKMERFHVHCLTCVLCQEVIKSNYFIFNGNMPICGEHDIDRLVKDGLIEIDTSSAASTASTEHDNTKSSSTNNTVEKRRTRLLNF